MVLEYPSIVRHQGVTGNTLRQRHAGMSNFQPKEWDLLMMRLIK